MAIDADGETSDPEPDSEVTDTSPTREQLVLEVDELNECLINQDKLIKRAARERNELKARLETALHKIEVFRACLFELFVYQKLACSWWLLRGVGCRIWVGEKLSLFV